MCFFGGSYFLVQDISTHSTNHDPNHMPKIYSCELCGASDFLCVLNLGSCPKNNKAKTDEFRM